MLRYLAEIIRSQSKMPLPNELNHSLGNGIFRYLASS